ncbi:uncharacterized protein SPAPADRAFT_63942 [Spathaspora passalidarum NRRL Y-27907]|uniref:Uncharacterized protein n=1 Tax=Spathaspora passalidarum (strain NRRL Y-27907 / 11-Y1) TaxID=619300 RepID=G3ADY5_SPAPN|nr:uncharacterized protein SPAPADRAFT_63942 [Spathaspora passalidarum NRRL Y-27907]EGW34709.1 hypothetical protein SPAPADRAFT_63942 [Spathaspora passalidarum NRRL Y-27907]
MSHPDASVKSICSGKINLDSPDDIYFNNNNSYNYPAEDLDIDDEAIDETFKNSGYEYLDDISSKESNYSVTSKNLKALDNQRVKFNDTNGTNLSLVSTESDYQRILEDSTSLLSPDFVGDSLSRPISRSSTTSCLSTTATKDGIEGRRFHRYGPTAYSSNIIANMVHSQQLQGKIAIPEPRNSFESNTSVGEDSTDDPNNLKKKRPISKHRHSQLNREQESIESDKT